MTRRFSLGFAFLTAVTVAVLVLFGITSIPRPQKTVTKTGETAKPRVLTAPTVTVADPVRGPKNAPVTLVEFGDFLCPYCAAAEPTIREFVAAHPREVRLVWKDFPIKDKHPLAEEAALAARCAEEQKKFWEYHDLLFANQESLSPSMLVRIAEELRLDLSRFENCQRDKTGLPRVERGLEEGAALAIDGVPYFFVNGSRLSGAATREMLEEMLKNARQ
ncbi:MAG: thioredoxin domain-containing protein [Patescibacteria group bacterium]